MDAPFFDSSEFFVPIVVQGSPVITFGVIDGASFSIPSIVPGSFPGAVILTTLLGFNEFYTSSLIYDLEIEPSFLESFELFNSQITGYAIDTDVLVGETFYSPELSVTLSTTYFESSSFFEPTIVAISEINPPFIDSLLFYNPEVTLESFLITTDGYIDESFVFRPLIRTQRIEPVRFISSETNLGGDIVRDSISPAQNYYLNPGPYSDKTSYIFSKVSSILGGGYVPSNDAIFARTFYRSIYIRNDSPFETRNNISFWVDGGHYYRTSSDETVLENRFFLEEEESLLGYQLEDRNDYLYNGSSRTSLFGNISVEYYIPGPRDLIRFNESGVAIGLNLNNQIFSPANRKASLPNLSPGEYVGIYLKITTKFKPDFPVKSDYSFFHLSYTNESLGSRDTYPGPSRFGVTNSTTFLPSVYLKVSTNYKKLETYLKEGVSEIYSKYPPYFLSLEDIGQDE